MTMMESPRHCRAEPVDSIAFQAVHPDIVFGIRQIALGKSVARPSLPLTAGVSWLRQSKIG
jgi:hypothetical protein